jgi:DNA-binding response OmpR family regulator
MAASSPVILVVEDQPQMRDLLGAVLTSAGYRVVEAPDGSTALAHLRTGATDLVLLDVVLPDFDGYAVARWIRAEPAFAQLPILMLTGLVTEADAVQGFSAGADDYVRKPFLINELLARVRRLLRQR